MAIGQVTFKTGKYATIVDASTKGTLSAGDICFASDTKQIWLDKVWYGGNYDNVVLNTRKVSAGTGLTGGGTLSADITITHSNHKAAGNLGESAAKTLTWGGTFKIPYITNDALGHITAGSDITITMPSNPNVNSSLVIGASATAAANAATANGTTFLNLLNGSTVANSHLITGSGSVSVAADANGKLTITGTTYPNQNAYSNVKIGTTTISAATTTDTIELAAGSNVTLTPDATNKKITIASTNSTYTLVTGTVNGTVAFNGTNVAVKGLGSNAYTSTAFAPLSSPALTGTPTAPTAAVTTNNTQIATTAYVTSKIDSVLAANDAMQFKGTIGTGGTITALPATHNAGDTYKAIAGCPKIDSKNVEVGDLVICIKDGTTAADADWAVVQTNIDGAVTGPASAVANHIAIFDGTTGKIIKDSGFTIATSVPANAKFTDTVYTLPLATASARGGVKIGYTTTGKNYAVLLSNEQMYVNVPWTDTDTKVTAAGNHYQPATVDASTMTATAGKYISAIKQDNKGHITGITEGTLPVNTDTHFTTKLVITDTSTKADNAATDNTKTYLNLFDNSTLRQSHQIVGAGSVSVAADANGKLTITGVNTVYTHPTTAGNIHLPVGGTANNVLVNSGAAGTGKWLSETIGGTAQPVYVNAGVLSKCTASVGSSSKPVYMNAGTITAFSTTVGGVSTPIYMNAGTITACSAMYTAASGTALETRVAALEAALTWVDLDAK